MRDHDRRCHGRHGRQRCAARRPQGAASLPADQRRPIRPRACRPSSSRSAAASRPPARTGWPTADPGWCAAPRPTRNDERWDTAPTATDVAACTTCRPAYIASDAAAARRRAQGRDQPRGGLRRVLGLGQHRRHGLRADRRRHQHDDHRREPARPDDALQPAHQHPLPAHLRTARLGRPPVRLPQRRHLPGRAGRQLPGDLGCGPDALRARRPLHARPAAAQAASSTSSPSRSCTPERTRPRSARARRRR